jgi:polysaccharide biosynthesis protein PslG
MSEGLSPSFHPFNSLKLLALLTSLSALATLAACAGVSTATAVHEPPPINTDNVCNTTPFTGSPANVPQPNPFFGMHIHALAPGTPWPNSVVPTVQFGGLRLWDSGTGWAETNTSVGVCDFSHMDTWFNEAQANNVDVLYNLARTPNWASSSPSDDSCNYADINGGGGQCDPPYDLNSDGTGTDDIWIGWVTSVVSRYKGKVKYYEIWNEWNISQFWSGTMPQLVRMTQDAYCIVEGPPAAGCNANSKFPNGTGLDPSAQIITPSTVGSGTSQNQLDAAARNMDMFLNQTQAGGMGPGSFVDIIGFHCYVSTQTVGDYPIPENVTTVDNAVATVAGVQGKPLFCTEGGSGDVTEEGFTDPNLQAAFLARFYLLQNSTSVSRVYWYAWDTTSTDIALWSPTDTTPAAIAYGEVYKWLNGATQSSPCSPDGTVYTCAYTRPGGYAALAVWDSNPTASCYTAGTPTCSTFTILSQYKFYRDVAGIETDVPGSTIPLTAKPILIETLALP